MTVTVQNLVYIETLVLLTIQNGLCNRTAERQLPCSYTALLHVLPPRATKLVHSHSL